MYLLKKLFSKSKKFTMHKGCKIDKNSTLSDWSGAMDYCTINNSEVGRYVSMADFISIGVQEPDFDKISTSSYLNGKRKSSRTFIGNDVWFGVDSLVKEGVHIGNGAVVGANSYVRDDVPDFAIVGGNPAKIIKYRFDEITRKKISESKYWEKDFVEAKEIVQKLQEDYNQSKDKV